MTSLFAATFLLLPLGAPSAAEPVFLQCQVTARVESQTSDRVQTQDWGLWEMAVDAEAGFVMITDGEHFAIDGRPKMLIAGDMHAEVSPDRITFCPAYRGCGRRLDNVSADGWYRIERGVLDRRRSTFHIVVERETASIGYHTITTYSGACGPKPPRQF